jgi:hypothetical protein
MSTSRSICQGLVWAIVVQGATASAGLAAFPRPAIGQKAMVTTAHPLATQAGLEVLRQGGNGIDAAVAATIFGRHWWRWFFTGADQKRY